MRGEANGRVIKFPCPSQLTPAAQGPRALYPKGSVAMSGAGDLMFVTQDTELPAPYTLLGEVTSGMDVINHDRLKIKSVRVQ